MIEILIAVSIMVTFSSLVGMQYHKKLIESKQSFSKIEMNIISQDLLLYHARTGQYPLNLKYLVDSQDLITLRPDPWGYDYVYLPKIEWLELIEIMENYKSSNLDLKKDENGESDISIAEPNEDKLKYFIETLHKISKTLSNLPSDGSIDLMKLLVVASTRGFVFCIDLYSPIFPSTYTDVMQDTNRVQKK
jgi:hypothetical protein